MKATVHILLLGGRKEKNRPSVYLAESVSRFAPLETWAICTTLRPEVHSI